MPNAENNNENKVQNGPVLPSHNFQNIPPNMPDGKVNPQANNLPPMQPQNIQNQQLKKQVSNLATNGLKKVPALGVLARTPMGRKAIEKVVNQTIDAVESEKTTQQSGGLNALPLPLGKRQSGLQRIKKFLNQDESNEGKEEEYSAVGEVTNFLKKIGKPMLAIGGSFLPLFIVFFIIFHENWGKISGTILGFESNGNSYSGVSASQIKYLSSCETSDSDACTDEKIKQINDEIKKIADEFRTKYGITIDTNLLLATVRYQDFDEMFDKMTDKAYSLDEFENEYYEIDDDLEVGTYPQSIDYSQVNLDYTDVRFMLWVLADKMAPLTIEVSQDDEDQINTARTRTLDLEGYRTFLKDYFIRNFYLFDTKEDKVESENATYLSGIYKNYDVYNYITSNNTTIGYTKVYANCPGVTVTDSEGNVEGVYPLEEYVAGVVGGESYPGKGIEAYKAQAIVARTFVLKATNNCTTSIENSEARQVFNPGAVTPLKQQAVDETKGLILLYQQDLFLSQYDSFCTSESCNYKEENGKIYADYTKLPNKETHTISIDDSYKSLLAGGHGQGMSQWVSYVMADNGSNYKDIIKYFYSDGVSISQMVATIGGEFSSNSETPIDKDDLKFRSDRYEQMKTYQLGNKSVDVTVIYKKTARNVGECVWYARSRALELILTSNMSDEQKAAAYDKIINVAANGKGWYSAGPLDYFEKSTNYEAPRVGAIVSWSSSKASGASHNYGHVAIIEEVDYANRTVVISDGFNTNGAGINNTWGSAFYRKRTLSFDKVKTYNDRAGYTFNGYVYVLG